MPQLLTISRAARLVNVSRGALQTRIRSGELASFDGMVSADELLRLFPGTKLEDEGIFERVTRIKEESFGQRVRERLLPSQEVLAQRLFEQSRELADLRAHLQRYHALVVRLEERIREVADGVPHEARALMAGLAGLLEREMESTLGESATPNPLAVMDDMLRVMAAHVVVHPSRHEFFVDGADTILEAALRAGLALNYGCSTGNCGLCKARVVSGQVKTVRHHDYVLSEAEKLQGYTLLCSHTAVSDLAIEALEAVVPGDIPEQQIGARVKALSHLGDEVMLLHLQTPRNNRLRFLAGQSVTLSTARAQPMQIPVASCPCDERNLQFHIERNPQHSFAERVFYALEQGDPITIWGPQGNFVLKADSPRDILFIACDTGFAPVKSLIEHAMALDVAEHMHLYWLACGPGGHYLANQCRAWADALDNFHYVALAEQGADARRRGAGQVAQRLLVDQLRLAELDVYLAGPQEFVDAFGTFLRQQRLPEDQLSATVI